MRDAVDIYLRQSLKNWASEQRTPANARARLLLVAASGQWEHPSAKSKDQAQGLPVAESSPVDQAMEIHNMPWVWLAQISLTPIRGIT
jgi:hypothetical protein